MQNKGPDGLTANTPAPRLLGSFSDPCDALRFDFLLGLWTPPRAGAIFGFFLTSFFPGPVTPFGILSPTFFLAAPFCSDRGQIVTSLFQMVPPSHASNVITHCGPASRLRKPLHCDVLFLSFGWACWTLSRWRLIVRSLLFIVCVNVGDLPSCMLWPSTRLGPSPRCYGWHVCVNLCWLGICFCVLIVSMYLFNCFKAVSGSICLSVITNAYMHARSTDGPTLFSAGRPCYVLRFVMVGVAGAGLAVVRFRPGFFLAGACSKSNSPSKPATK